MKMSLAVIYVNYIVCTGIALSWVLTLVNGSREYGVKNVSVFG